jgi:hypothetical protein
MSDNLARKILRAWYATLSAYPEAARCVQVRETARAARVRQEDVEAALGHTF